MYEELRLKLLMEQRFFTEFQLLVKCKLKIQSFKFAF
jgi:hypothetical protein